MSAIKRFGLVGKNISYSFSRGYFSEKFEELNLTNHVYQNFDLNEIEDFPEVFVKHSEELIGMNVTIPYKEKVGAYLDEIDEDAKQIGAINTIKILSSGKRVGYNTDVYGFQNSISPLIKEDHKKALILGTGGASKAVAYAFSKLNIAYKFVSRVPKDDTQISYDSINEALLKEYTVIVNCSPIGTSPDVHLCPNLPYECLSGKHLLYDLIYNPAESTFLRKGKEQGAVIKNGLQMLELQAEKSWEIWNNE
jgi:shikimate dehydrogenase